MNHAIVLLSHGSRDPLWRAPAEAVAARIAAQKPGRQVRCAYLELCAPSLPDAAGQLVARGATQVTVLPMFLGAGLRGPPRGVQFAMNRALGPGPPVTGLMAHIACGAPPESKPF